MDLQVATQVATAMIATLGLDKQNNFNIKGNENLRSERSMNEVADKVDNIMAEAYDLAKRALKEHEEYVHSLARVLLDQKIISRKAIMEMEVEKDGKLSFSYTDIIMRLRDRGMIPFFEDKKDFLPANIIRVRDFMRKKIIKDPSPKIIVSSSGNGSYGASKSYIKELIQRRDVLIHFTGHCTEGTLGYLLKTTPKKKTVWFSGSQVVKRADVEFTNEFSAHAKANELIGFFKKFKNPRLILVNHGSDESKTIFADRVVKEINCSDVGILGKCYILIKNMPI